MRRSGHVECSQIQGNPVVLGRHAGGCSTRGAQPDGNLAWLMDDAFRIPGTSYRIGLDGIVGLVPGIGDFATLLVGAIFLQEARRLGASRWTQARMCGNYAIDFLVGVIPLVGDLFDFGFKANRRNLRLLQQHLERQSTGVGGK
jgi:hypothetical protein